MSFAKYVFACLFFITVLLITSCSEDSFPTIDSSYKTYIASQVDTTMAIYNLPGVTVGLWLKGHTPYIKSWGVSNATSNAELNPQDVFRVGGITGTFTAMTILRLADEGNLNLNNAIHTYLPTFPNGTNITVKQLLAMQSGLGELTDNPEYRLNYFNDPTFVYTHDQLISLIGTIPIHFAPGAKTEYCSSNYYLLGRILQNVGVDTAENVINRYTVEPELLLKTKFPTDSSIPGIYTHGYISDVDSLLIDRTLLDPAFKWSAGAMTSSVRDLQSWFKVLYSGSMLTPATHTLQMTFNDLEDLPGMSYGLGIAKWGNLYGHSGYIQGFSTSAWYSPDHDAYIVIMTNRYNDDGADIPTADILAADIMNYIFPDLTVRAPKLPH